MAEAEPKPESPRAGGGRKRKTDPPPSGPRKGRPGGSEKRKDDQDRRRILRQQRRLIENGYLPEGADDGIWGPKSKAAWQEFKDNEFTPKWANEPAKPAPGGDAGGGGAGGGGGAAGAADEATGETGLVGVPGGAKLWKVGDDHYVVIDVPGAKAHISWRVANKADLDRITRSGREQPDRVLTAQEFRRTGAINFGVSREISNTDQHPWDVFRDRFRAEVKVKPWLRDPEMLAVHAASWIEKKSDPSIAEIQATEWWRTHTPEERSAMERYFGEAGGKPVSKSATFKRDWQVIADQVQKQMIAAGYEFDGNRQRVVNHYTRELLWGRMTKEQFESELTRIANPFATGATRTAGYTRGDLPKGAKAVTKDGRVYLRWRGKDYALREGYEVAAFGRGAKKVNKVRAAGPLRGLLRQGAGPADVDAGAITGFEQTRNLILEWIGPQLARGWSDREIAVWATRIQENENAQQELIDKLRGIRAARYQGYDPNLTYEDIATVGRAQVVDAWGQRMKETDPLFQKVLQLNDAEEAAKVLRAEGRRRGVAKVVNEASSDMLRAMGGTVRR